MKAFSHYINAMEYKALDYLYQRRGWSTKRKIVVFESDDWGSTRMRSIKILNKLISMGIPLNPNLGFDRFDTLASNDDFELLMEILCSFKDSKGNHPKITMNYIMTNPNFCKIRDSYFNEYHYEIFTETLTRYPKHDRSFDLLKEGIDCNIFKPQFHGREHLNVPMWLDALRKDLPGVRVAFDNEIYSNSIDMRYDKRGRFLDAYNVETAKDYTYMKEAIDDGLQIFKNIFGYDSQSSIAPNYTWDKKIEYFLSLNRVKYLQGTTRQVNTLFDRSLNNKRFLYHFLGELNSYNQQYLIRNCFFEPSCDIRLSSDKCLSDISRAFSLNKPAIISTHRLNYIGSLSEKNRDTNLKDFNSMLKKILEVYPDVEFLSSDELGNLLVK